MQYIWQIETKVELRLGNELVNRIIYLNFGTEMEHTMGFVI